MFVYRFVDKAGKVLYVGKTKNMKNRFKQHFGKAGHLPKECYDRVHAVEYFEAPNELVQSIYELMYINKYKPPYNTKDKYDSSGHLGGYVQVQKQEWLPYMVRSDGWEYAGKISNTINDIRDNTENIMDNIEISKENTLRILNRYKVSGADRELIARQFRSLATSIKRGNTKIIKKLRES